MNAPEVLEVVQSLGGSLSLRLSDMKIQYELPDSAAWLVTELEQNRNELIELLKESTTPPPMPPGVRLLKWKPKNPPVAIVRIGIVSNVHKFVDSTLQQLKARLDGRNFAAGNWSLRELIDRLEQVGVAVEVEATQSGGQQK